MNRNLFNSVKLTKPKYSYFDLSHDVKLSFNMGELVPVMCMECLPSDRFNLSAESLIRFAPLTSPVMHRMDAYIHYFFVPNRIIWDNWEKFITNTPITRGGTDIPAFPTFNFSGIDNALPVTRLANYLGLPLPSITSGTQVDVSALPFQAYNKIWYEYYRDQNLQDVDFVELQDGDNGSLGLSSPILDQTILRNRAWEHDYFTAALPFAQKGPNVDIPLGDVKLKGPNNAGVQGRFVHATNHSVFATTGGAFLQTGNTGVLTETSTAGAGTVYDPAGTLEVDATTINDLRRAFKLQEWFERNARGGTRYFEHILAHFGLRSPDARLQRPEYICGVRTPVQISEVLNTTGTSSLPQGNMAGHGIGVVSGQSGHYTCQEHGYIIGIMSIMPRTAYYQGIPKHFLKTGGFEDFAYPTFAHLGEQEVGSYEIWAIQDNAVPDSNTLWGYVPRYSEYKYMPSRTAGDFSDSLLFWHLARKFDNKPALNEEFIKCVPRTDIFAVEEADVQKMWVHVLNKVGATRPLPKYGNPSFG